MSSEAARLPEAEPYYRGGQFPGDPRYLGYALTPKKLYVNALKSNEWLSTHLLDLNIQRTGMCPDSPAADPFAPILGSLGAEAYISSTNLTALLQRAEVKSSAALKSYQEFNFNHWKSHCLIVPIVHTGHSLLVVSIFQCIAQIPYARFVL
jgi:hypothetical protein